ncbi:MAG: cysteine--tRNA ligase [Pseudomonadota bacterium]
MALKFYNTASRKIEHFVPMASEHIKFYLCGPTIYDDIHIGNARPLVVFDVLYRLLLLIYGNVTFVRNVTDVDDKIIARAKLKKLTIDQLCKQTHKRFLDDVKALQCLAPTHQPRASEYINSMIFLIKRLIDQGIAYENDGHVLFSAKAWPDYGVFANRHQDDLRAGARVEVADYKRDSMDFVLWKPSLSDTPGWDSPWGYGRPGWHIECSAMAYDLLGQDFDLHAGGQDLIFPHHQNEIAQSCAAFPGSHFAKYWLHNGYVLCDGQKMSKSLGNFYTVRDLRQTNSAQALRMGLLQSHYRQPLDFSSKRMVECAQILTKFYKMDQNHQESLCKKPFALEDREHEKHLATSQSLDEDPVLSSLTDDLNTPRALSGLYQLFNIWDQTPNGRNHFILKRALWVLGLMQQSQADWASEQDILKAGQQKTSADVEKLSKEQIDQLVAERDQARRDKNFERADALRNQLAQHDIIVEDAQQGSIWHRK